eukprot:6853383-Pyramimonas_sp.AAC.1
MRAKTRVCGARVPSHIDAITDRFAAAANFSFANYQRIKIDPQYMYRLAPDVFRSDMYWNVPTPFSPSFVWQHVSEAANKLHRTCQFEGHTIRHNLLRARFGA